MATVTIYSDTADGYVQSLNTTYATARSGGTLTADTTATTVNIGQTAVTAGYGANYYCYEAFFGFDTSSISSTATLASATLALYGSNGTTTNFTIEARVYDWSTTVTTADYVAGASLSALTSLATFNTADGVGFSTTGYNYFTDVALPANINRSGFTRIICYSSRHSGNNTPTPDVAEYVVSYSSNASGTTTDPKVIVTYLEPAYSIKKISGVTRAQIKKVTGLTNE